MDTFLCDARNGNGFEPAITAFNELRQQFKEITKEIPPNPNRAFTYSKDGGAYCIKMKRKFDEAMHVNRAVNPMYEPEVPKYDLTNDTTDNEIKFVNEFKIALNAHRMNWHDLLEGRTKPWYYSAVHQL
jgi:hypothetical protein